MSAGASGFPSGESMNRGQIGPGADARRPRVGPSTVRATSHRHRPGTGLPPMMDPTGGPGPDPREGAPTVRGKSRCRMPAPRMPRKPPAPPPMPGHGPGWIGGAGRMQSGKTAVCPAPEA